MKYFIYLFVSISLLSCSSFIEPPELISIEDFMFLGKENEKFVFSSNIILLNKNNFKLKTEEIKSEVFFNSKSIGEFLINKEFIIDKKSSKKISALIFFNPENIDSLLFNDNSKKLLIKGYVKTPLLNKSINFKYDYIFNLKTIMDSFVDEQISNSVFKIKEVKLDKIKYTNAQLEILLNFYNDLGFNFNINKLSSIIYKDLNKSKIIARSENINTISIENKNNVDFPVKLNVNLLSIDPMMLLGTLRNDLNLYIDFNFIVQVFENEFPIHLSRKIIINPKNFEITIQ
jgi:LEA14-like dessication related protein